MEVHSRIWDALDELKKDSYRGDCEASVKTRWIELELVLVDIRSCCHLKDSELASVVMFILFESLR